MKIPKRQPETDTEKIATWHSARQNAVRGAGKKLSAYESGTEGVIA